LQNFPNPFNPETTIRYGIDEAGPVRLTIANQLGAEVAVILEEWRSAGQHEVRWNATNSNGMKVAAGIYYVRLISGETVLHKPMVLLR
jgi:flagellar hook assembly protein FlgD